MMRNFNAFEIEINNLVILKGATVLNIDNSVFLLVLLEIQKPQEKKGITLQRGRDKGGQRRQQLEWQYRYIFVSFYYQSFLFISITMLLISFLQY